MKSIRAALLLSLLSPLLPAGELVEVSATLVKIEGEQSSSTSQLELRRQLVLARNRGAEDLLKLSAVVESGKWASIKRGREFWHPTAYSDAKVHQAAGDDDSYSIPQSTPAKGNQTVIIPNSPTKMAATELGASLRVKPTIKEHGLIYLEGVFKDTVFEGLSEEAIPIKVETKKIVRQSRVHEIMKSRTDQPVFRKVEKDFGVMLPYSAGSSVDAKRLREAKSKYTYYIPIVLGNTAFGAPGKVELKQNSGPTGPIRSTMMKATMVKDFFIRKKTESSVRENGILILEVKKVERPSPVRTNQSSRKILLRSKFIESENSPTLTSPLLTNTGYEAEITQLTSRRSADLLSAPSVTIQSGQTGKIEMIKELSFPNEFLAPSLENSTRSPVVKANPVSSKTKDVGVTLKVTGTLEDHDMIRLNVVSSVVVFEGFLDFGNPVMGIKTGMIKKLRPNTISENKVDMPVFPFRSTETELLVPNGSHVAMTMIFDHHNLNHYKERLLRIRKAKVEEVKTPRHLTIFLSPSILQ